MQSFGKSNQTVATQTGFIRLNWDLCSTQCTALSRRPGMVQYTKKDPAIVDEASHPGLYLSHWCLRYLTVQDALSHMSRSRHLFDEQVLE